MTARAAPIFALSTHNSTPLAALVSLSVTGAVVYTDVRCTARRDRRGTSFPCNSWLFALPGHTPFTIRLVASQQDRTGEGIAARCPKCNTLYEVTR